MNDLTLCYKVVRHPGQDSELRWSLLAPLKYEVAYLPGRRTTPMVEGTKLYGFASREKCLEFLQINASVTADEIEVWLALAEGVKPCKWVSGVVAFHDRFLDDFWKLTKRGDPSIGNYWVNEPPLGTIECEAVTLIQCLDRIKGIKEPDYIVGTSA